MYRAELRPGVLTEGVAGFSRTSGEVTDLRILEKTILHDFYLSFKFSQGNPTLQAAFYKLLHRQYRMRLTEDTLAVMQARGSLLWANILELQPPKRHAEVTERRRQNIVKMEWGGFIDEALHGSGSLPTSETVQKFMIARDAAYVESGRPHTPPGADPFASHTREYLIIGKATTSAAFDAIFTDVSPSLRGENNPNRDNLCELKEAWVRKHPDTLFFPLSETVSASS